MADGKNVRVKLEKGEFSLSNASGYVKNYTSGADDRTNLHQWHIIGPNHSASSSTGKSFTDSIWYFPKLSLPLRSL